MFSEGARGWVIDRQAGKVLEISGGYHLRDGYLSSLIVPDLLTKCSFLADCDGINEKEYAQLAKTKSKYSCVLCRGEREERMDSFHRKNRNKNS